MNASICHSVFERCIQDYHLMDRVDAPLPQPFDPGSIEALLYHKCWVDTVQWHLEDLVRDPLIQPELGLFYKRKIDASNQVRTDLVENIDAWLLQFFKSVQPVGHATFNTESPAWAIDRLSILNLKIFHMRVESLREDASEAHKRSCKSKYDVLTEQRQDLMLAIDQLLSDIGEGKKYMKVYRQMKMYNDASLNPVLYQQKNVD